MSKKCRAYSESKLGLEPADNRKAFYAGWEAAIKYVHASDMFEKHVHISDKHRHEPEDDLYDVWVETATCQQNQQVAKNATTKRGQVGAKSGLRWVGLTQKEFLQCAQLAERGNYFLAITFAQQTLKEKNEKNLQKKWVFLETDEIMGMTCECIDDGTFNMDCAVDFARTLETVLRDRYS